MSRLLLQDVPAPHRIDVYRGATAEDVAETRASMEMVSALARSAMRGYLINLAQNLPIGTIDVDDRMNELSAMLHDWIGDTFPADRMP